MREDEPNTGGHVMVLSSGAASLNAGGETGICHARPRAGYVPPDENK